MSLFEYQDSSLLFGTRFLFFIFLLDFGLLGCAIFIFWFFALLKTAVRSRSQYAVRTSRYATSIFIISFLNDGYFFIFLLFFLASTVTDGSVVNKWRLSNEQSSNSS